MNSTTVAALRPANVTSRLPALTGLRFVAALMVFMFHAINAFIFADKNVQSGFDRLFHQAASGVSFFFVLSGFVLTWAVRPTDSIGAFLRRRVVRIYPNHLVTYVVAFSLITWGAGMTIGVGPAIANLFLVQSWFPDLMYAYSVNVVSWTLACEVFFYAMFPVMLFVVARIRPERLWAWFAGVVAAIVAVAVFATNVLPGLPLVPETGMPEWQQWFADLFPPTRLLECVAGMLLARIVLTRRKLPINFPAAVGLLVAAYFLAWYVPRVYAISAVTILPVSLVIATTATASLAGRPKVLSSRLMVTLGNLSFSFYLWHLLVMIVMRPTLGGPQGWNTPAALGILVVLFAITLGLAWLTYTFVERPLMRRFGTARRTPAANAPDVAAPTSPVPAETTT